MDNIPCYYFEIQFEKLKSRLFNPYFLPNAPFTTSMNVAYPLIQSLICSIPFVQKQNAFLCKKFCSHPPF